MNVTKVSLRAFARVSGVLVVGMIVTVVLDVFLLDIILPNEGVPRTEIVKYLLIGFITATLVGLLQRSHPALVAACCWIPDVILRFIGSGYTGIDRQVLIAVFLCSLISVAIWNWRNSLKRVKGATSDHRAPDGAFKAVIELAFVGVVIAGIGMIGFAEDNGQRFLPYRWQVMESPDASFTVSFPGRQSVFKTSIVERGDGSSFISNRLSVQHGRSVSYVVMWWAEPVLNEMSADEALSRAQDQAIKCVPGKIVRKKELVVQGYPATDVQAYTIDHAEWDSRIVRVGSVVYTLIVIDATGYRDERNIKKFFDSFLPRDPKHKS